MIRSFANHGTQDVFDGFLEMTSLPKSRPPTHPGEMLREEFLSPLGMSQTELAQRIGVSYPRINEIINGKRGVTPDTALRLAKLFGTTPEFWLNGQRNWDLWQAMHSPKARDIQRIKPVAA
jgi:addiction module HigA family antidote